MTRGNSCKRYGKDNWRKVFLIVVLLFSWLAPSYHLFVGTWALTPKDNIEVSLLVGWAFSIATISLASLTWKELEMLWERLSS